MSGLNSSALRNLRCNGFSAVLGISGFFCGALSYPFFMLLVIMTQKCLIPSEYAIPITDSDNRTLCMMGNHFSGLFNQTKTLGQSMDCKGYFYMNATTPDIATQIADQCWEIFNHLYYDPENDGVEKSSQWVFYFPPILIGLSLLALLADNLRAKYSASASVFHTSGTRTPSDAEVGAPLLPQGSEVFDEKPGVPL